MSPRFVLDRFFTGRTEIEAERILGAPERLSMGGGPLGLLIGEDEYFSSRTCPASRQGDLGRTAEWSRARRFPDAEKQSQPCLPRRNIARVAASQYSCGKCSVGAE